MVVVMCHMLWDEIRTNGKTRTGNMLIVQQKVVWNCSDPSTIILLLTTPPSPSIWNNIDEHLHILVSLSRVNWFHYFENSVYITKVEIRAHYYQAKGGTMFSVVSENGEQLGVFIMW